MYIKGKMNNILKEICYTNYFAKSLGLYEMTGLYIIDATAENTHFLKLFCSYDCTNYTNFSA